MWLSNPNSPPVSCQWFPSVLANPSENADCDASGVDKLPSNANIPTMDRRTFVVLSGTTASGLVRPRCDFDPRRLAARGDIGRLLFDFDAQWRWSLSYRAEGNSVPVIDATALGVWIEDRLILLADLQDITSEHRPTAEGEALAISGGAAGAPGGGGLSPGAPGRGPRWGPSCPRARRGPCRAPRSPSPSLPIGNSRGCAECATV